MKYRFFSTSPPIEGPESDARQSDPWEAAYLRFETPEQEVDKFVKRLIKVGAARWSRDAEVAELFCGRGSGLHALSKLGFTRLTGVDLSASLLIQYTGPAKVCVSDCRNLSFTNLCKDIVVIHGGLHHLSVLSHDLDQTLAEIHRILKDNGLLIVVEPWLTPFLSLVHTVCRTGIARRLSRKIDALATMILYEQQTYQQWLSQPKMILSQFERYFHANQCSFQWGKFIFVGRKKVGKSRIN